MIISTAFLIGLVVSLPPATLDHLYWWWAPPRDQAELAKAVPLFDEANTRELTASLRRVQ